MLKFQSKIFDSTKHNNLQQRGKRRYKIVKLIESNEKHNESRYCEELKSSQLAPGSFSMFVTDMKIRQSSEKPETGNEKWGGLRHTGVWLDLGLTP